MDSSTNVTNYILKNKGLRWIFKLISVANNMLKEQKIQKEFQVKVFELINKVVNLNI